MTTTPARSRSPPRPPRATDWLPVTGRFTPTTGTVTWSVCGVPAGSGDVCGSSEEEGVEVAIPTIVDGGDVTATEVVVGPAVVDGAPVVVGVTVEDVVGAVVGDVDVGEGAVVVGDDVVGADVVVPFVVVVVAGFLVVVVFGGQVVVVVLGR